MNWGGGMPCTKTDWPIEFRWWHDFDCNVRPQATTNQPRVMWISSLMSLHSASLRTFSRYRKWSFFIFIGVRGTVPSQTHEFNLMCSCIALSFNRMWSVVASDLVCLNFSTHENYLCLKESTIHKSYLRFHIAEISRPLYCRNWIRLLNIFTSRKLLCPYYIHNLKFSHQGDRQCKGSKRLKETTYEKNNANNAVKCSRIYR
jgi:hypothetical protein